MSETICLDIVDMPAHWVPPPGMVDFRPDDAFKADRKFRLRVIEVYSLVWEIRQYSEFTPDKWATITKSLNARLAEERQLLLRHLDVESPPAGGSLDN